MATITDQVRPSLPDSSEPVWSKVQHHTAWTGFQLRLIDQRESAPADPRTGSIQLLAETGNPVRHRTAFNLLYIESPAAAAQISDQPQDGRESRPDTPTELRTVPGSVLVRFWPGSGVQENQQVSINVLQVGGSELMKSCREFQADLESVSCSSTSHVELNETKCPTRFWSWFWSRFLPASSALLRLASRRALVALGET